MIDKMLDIFLADRLNISLVVFIMVCALIVFLGFIKPFTFDKIKNKDVRKTLLYFSSILLAFAYTAIAFWVKGWNFVYYWYAGGAFASVTIIVYSAYEGTNLKHLVDKVGNKTWKRLLGLPIPQSTEELKNELNEFIEDIKLLSPNKKVEQNKHDKELDNL